MKLWHPQRFLYYHKFSSRVHKAIENIVELNDSMSSDIKYKPWEEVVKEPKPLSSEASLKSQSSIKSNLLSQENIDPQNTEENSNEKSEENLQKSLSSVDKNKIINVSLDAEKQTIVISTEDLPVTSNTNVAEENNINTTTTNTANTENVPSLNERKSSVSLFSDDHSELDGK